MQEEFLVDTVSVFVVATNQVSACFFVSCVLLIDSARASQWETVALFSNDQRPFRK